MKSKCTVTTASTQSLTTAKRKKSKKKSKKRNLKRNVKRGVGRLATKRTFGSRDQNPEKLQQWKIVE